MRVLKIIVAALLIAALSGALVSFLSQKTNIKCSGRLQDRPIKELMDQLKLSGLTFSEDKLPFTVDGTFHKIDFEFPRAVFT